MSKTYKITTDKNSASLFEDDNFVERFEGCDGFEKAVNKLEDLLNKEKTDEPVLVEF